MDKISSIQIDIYRGWRGGQRQVELLCRGLAKRGHPVAVVTRPNSLLAAQLKNSPVEVIPVRVGFELDPLAALKTASALRKRKPAIVNMHASHSHTLGVLARRFTSNGPKFVVTRRVDFSPGRDPFNKWKYIKGPDAYIAISEAIQNVLIDFGIHHRRIHLVHSGVPSMPIPAGARQKLTEKMKLPKDAILIGDIADLVDHKGHRFLIDAIPEVIDQFPQAMFLLVGDGELRSELTRQAYRRQITEKNLRFLGNQKDIPLILGALDLFVMTSHLEGLNTSIIDAQLAGIPVVATRAGGIPELVIHNETGLLARNRDSHDIAEKLIQILRDADLRNRLKGTARKQATDRFTNDAMVEGTIQAYRKILGL